MQHVAPNSSETIYQLAIRTVEFAFDYTVTDILSDWQCPHYTNVCMLSHRDYAFFTS